MFLQPAGSEGVPALSLMFMIKGVCVHVKRVEWCGRHIKHFKYPTLRITTRHWSLILVYVESGIACKIHFTRYGRHIGSLVTQHFVHKWHKFW